MIPVSVEDSLIAAVEDATFRAEWADLIEHFSSRRPDRAVAVPIAAGEAVAIPFALGDTEAGYVLLAFPGTAPALAPLQSAVELLSHSLCERQHSQMLRQRIVQLERQQASRLREIRDSRNYLRGIIDNIVVGLVLIDSDGTVRAINNTLARRFGLEPARLVGKHYSPQLGDWSDAPAAHTLASGQTASRRVELIQPDGSRALIAISSFPLFDANQTIQRAVEVWDDITEQTALQNQLIRVEKLAALGQLAASIAHEVGNPLQAIQGFIALFLESCPADVANRPYLQVAEQEIERVARVIARLRDFYRPSTDATVAIQMNRVLEDVLLLANKQLQRSRVTVVKRLAHDLPEVLGVADQLKQVLLNLVLNAIEAMPDGGTLTIVSQEYTGEANLVQRNAQDILAATAEHSIIVRIADTGLGIPPDRLAQLFDGLQTTKARGMGLGLYTSKAILDRHLGRITVDSSPGKGTTFTIVLPVHGEEPQL